MNRIEFMKQLETLLNDISADERAEAMQYYNDYFDDAGAENEEHIISELGSPVKVAATIKAGLRGTDDQSSQYSETGYTDTRFEEKESPAKREPRKEQQQQQNTQRESEGYSKGYSQGNQETPRTSTPLKILLIVLIVIVAIPTVIPVGIGLLATALSLVFVFFVLLVCLIFISVVIAVVGIVLFISGFVHMFATFPFGLALIGIGLILFAVGLVGTVFSTKLCIVVIPCTFRALVELCRRPFRKREVSA